LTDMLTLSLHDALPICREDRHSNFCDDSDENAPDAFVRVGDALSDEQSVARIENDVSNQGVERVADQPRCAMLNKIDTFGCRGRSEEHTSELQSRSDIV